VTDEQQARDHRTMLDLLARSVTWGFAAELGMYYPDALQAFGADSRHVIAACQGQSGVGLHYLRTVDGGIFRDAR
jgi:hypothetical protein